MKNLTIAIPSIYPKRALRLSKSIKLIDGINVDLSMVVNEDFDNEILKEINPKFLMRVKQEEIPSMYWLRSMTFAMASNTDYYMLADDDLHWGLFGSEYIKECIDWLENNKDFGILQTNSEYGEFIKEPNECIISTARGIYIRNIDGGIIEHNNIVGGCEEPLFVFYVMSKGYKLAQRGSGACIRKEGYHTIAELHESKIHSIDIFEENSYKIIEEKYNMKNWDVLTGILPIFNDGDKDGNCNI